MIRATSASVKYPNTSESDLQPRVMHVVTLSSGTTQDIMAADPLDAIEALKPKEVLQ